MHRVVAVLLVLSLAGCGDTTTSNTDTTVVSTPAVSTSEPAATDEEAIPDLRLGDDGQWVVMVQQQLTRHGYPLEADGEFGPVTDAAVREFQEAHGLDPTGVVDETTWVALDSSTQAPQPTIDTAPTDTKGVTVSQVLEPYEPEPSAETDFTNYELDCHILVGEPSSNWLGWDAVKIDRDDVVDRGSVLSCEVRTEPPSDRGGPDLIVLDDQGSTTSWWVGTDEVGHVPFAPPGLLCREYIATEEYDWAMDWMLQGDGGSPPWTDDVLAYQWTLAYWFLEGEPDRMDVDRNDIPCELLFDPSVVAEVWATGTLGSSPTPPTDPFLIPPGVVEDGWHFGYLVRDNGTSFSFDRIDIQPTEGDNAIWKNDNPKVRTLPVSPTANLLNGAAPGTPIVLVVAGQHVEWVKICGYRDSAGLCQDNQ